MNKWRWKLIFILLYAVVSMVWMGLWIIEKIIKLII